MELNKFFTRGLWAWASLVAAVMLSACHSTEVDPYHPIAEPQAAGPAVLTDDSSYALRVGDELTVTFLDLPPSETIPPIIAPIREDGTVTLIHNQKFHAAGQTISELETTVHNWYIDNKYYKHLTVNIVLPNRTFSVGGEVRQPGSFKYPGEMTVLEAINVAGGFTDYANHTVQLTRADHKRQENVDADKALTNPKLDLPVLPGDTINVKHRWP